MKYPRLAGNNQLPHIQTTTGAAEQLLLMITKKITKRKEGEERTTKANPGPPAVKIMITMIERFHLLAVFFVSDVRTVYENFVVLFYFRCGVLFSLNRANLCSIDLFVTLTS